VSRRARRGVVIAGGGTAGHVLPGLAIAAALVDRGIVAGRDEVHLVGSRRGIENTLVPAAGFSLTVLPGRGIQRRLTPANLGALWGLLRALVMGWWLLLRRRPRALVALGGYASVPCGLAAVVLRVPLIVAEQNAVPGAANRLLGRFASVCAVAFDDTGLPRAENVGNPVRAEVRALAAGRGRADARAALDLDDRPFVVVFGGSLGARRINRAVVDLVGHWAHAPMVVHHVIGSRDFADPGLRPSTVASGVDHRVIEYEHDLPSVLAAADLVVCRAGATTVAELAVIGVPALLIPLPGAPGDHQTANARALVDRGAAVLVPDHEVSADRLASEVAGLLADPDRLTTMAASGAAVGRPDAADAVAHLVGDRARG